MAHGSAGISYKIEYLRINRTCPASTCGIFHTLYEPKFQVALTHRNWTGGLLPVNASSYILGASIQPLAWLCVGCSGLVRVYQACAVFPMLLYTSKDIPSILSYPFCVFMKQSHTKWQSRATQDPFYNVTTEAAQPYSFHFIFPVILLHLHSHLAI